MKLYPQHLPLGTIVELNDDIVHLITRNNHDRFREVRGIVQNGVDSFVFKTGRVREHTGEEGFNFDHIKRIVRRGWQGPAPIDYGGFASHPPTPQELAYVERMRLLRIPDFLPEVPHFRLKRGFDYTFAYDGDVYLHHLVNSMVPPGLAINTRGMFEHVVRQTWVIRFRYKTLAGFDFSIIGFNKKRLRKWIKANYNRFLISVKAARRAEDAHYDALYDRHEEEFDQELSLLDVEDDEEDDDEANERLAKDRDQAEFSKQGSSYHHDDL